MPLEIPLASHLGRWQGSNRLHDPHTGSPDDSPSAVTIEPLLQNRFVRVNYTWQYQKKPQEGSILLAFDPSSKDVTAHWIDSWHMGQAAMSCAGTRDEHGSVVLKGTYAAPPGPDWGWRIELDCRDSDALSLRMFNITPEGESSPAVEATYSREAPPGPTIRQVAVVVSDVDRSLTFYRDVLGLKFLFRPGPNLAFLAAGEVRIMLSLGEGTPTISGDSILYLKVDGTRSKYEVCVGRGATPERAPQLTAKMPDHDLWIGFVRDPDNRLVGLLEERPPSGSA